MASSADSSVANEGTARDSDGNPVDVKTLQGGVASGKRKTDALKRHRTWGRGGRHYLVWGVQSHWSSVLCSQERGGGCFCLLPVVLLVRSVHYSMSHSEDTTAAAFVIPVTEIRTCIDLS